MNKLIILLTFLACSVLAEERNSPESVMLEYAEASKSWATKRIAALMHPDALKEIRDAFESALTGKSSERAREELLPLFSVQNYDEFKSLSDRMIYQRMMDKIAQMKPEFFAMFRNVEYKISHSVEDGDEVIVIYKISMLIEGNPVAQEVVQRLRKDDDKWYMVLPPSGEATIAGIRAQF